MLPRPRAAGLIVRAVVVFAAAACSGDSDSEFTRPQPAVASVRVTLSAPVLSVGETATLTAVALDADGNPLPDTPVTFASSHSAVASVDARGVVTGVGPGVATLTATIEKVTGSTPITVRGSITLRATPDEAVSPGEIVRLLADGAKLPDAVDANPTLTATIGGRSASAARMGDTAVAILVPADLGPGIADISVELGPYVTGEGKVSVVTAPPVPDPVGAIDAAIAQILDGLPSDPPVGVDPTTWTVERARVDSLTTALRAQVQALPQADQAVVARVLSALLTEQPAPGARATRTSPDARGRDPLSIPDSLVHGVSRMGIDPSCVTGLDARARARDHLGLTVTFAIGAAAAALLIPSPLSIAVATAAALVAYNAYANATTVYAYTAAECSVTTGINVITGPLAPSQQRPAFGTARIAATPPRAAAGGGVAYLTPGRSLALLLSADVRGLSGADIGVEPIADQYSASDAQLQAVIDQGRSGLSLPFTGFTPLSATTPGATQSVPVEATEADWTSSAPSIASVTPGSVLGVSRGTATISTTYGTKTASLTTTVGDPVLELQAPASLTATIQRGGGYDIGVRCDLTSSVSATGGIPVGMTGASFTLRDRQSRNVLATASDNPGAVFGTTVLDPNAAPTTAAQWFGWPDPTRAVPLTFEYVINYAAAIGPDRTNVGPTQTARYTTDCIPPASNVTLTSRISATVHGVVSGVYLTCGTTFQYVATGTGYATFLRSEFRATPLAGVPGKQVTPGGPPQPNIIAGETSPYHGMSSQWGAPDHVGGPPVPQPHRVEYEAWYESGGTVKSVIAAYDCVP